MKGLETEVGATLQMFVDNDLKSDGKLSAGTLEAIRVQGYEYKDGQLQKPVATPPEKVNPLKTAEMTMEQNLNMIDGVLNNQPTVAELEAKANSGETISLSDLAGAIKAERTEPGERRSANEKPSIREQLRQGKEQLAKAHDMPEKSAQPHRRVIGERS